MKKAFLEFFTDSSSGLAVAQLVEFVNRNRLKASDYHLVTTFVVRHGLSDAMHITCIYHSLRKLS